MGALIFLRVRFPWLALACPGFPWLPLGFRLLFVCAPAQGVQLIVHEFFISLTKA
jgi:hypothetical protein